MTRLFGCNNCSHIWEARFVVAQLACPKCQSENVVQIGTVDSKGKIVYFWDDDTKIYNPFSPQK